MKAIRPSVVATASKPEAERMRAAILENVEETLNDMITGSAILRELGQKGHVTFIGAYYELGSGKVYFPSRCRCWATRGAACKPEATN